MKVFDENIPGFSP